MTATKSFDDLEFHSHNIFHKLKRAVLFFDNGYGISVIVGTGPHVHEPNKYEVAVMHHGSPCYNTPITSGTIGYISKEQINEIMNELVRLSPDDDGYLNGGFHYENTCLCKTMERGDLQRCLKYLTEKYGK